MWIPGPNVTPKTPVRMSKIDVKRFHLQCIICGKKNAGACEQCQYPRCQISFHIECARRANYFLEVERIDRERVFRVFCEKHRPLKIVRELEEKDKQTLDEVHKFSKVIDKCLEKSTVVEAKILRTKRMAPFSKPAPPLPPTKKSMQAEKRQERLNLAEQKRKQKEAALEAKRQARLAKEAEKQEKERLKMLAKEQATVVAKPLPVNKWREKDKKILYDRVRDRYLQLLKLRFNVIKVDPMIKIKKKQERLQKKKESQQKQVEKKRKQKLAEKQHEFAKAVARMALLSQREGLRSRNPAF